MIIRIKFKKINCKGRDLYFPQILKQFFMNEILQKNKYVGFKTE